MTSTICIVPLALLSQSYPVPKGNATRLLLRRLSVSPSPRCEASAAILTSFDRIAHTIILQYNYHCHWETIVFWPPTKWLQSPRLSYSAYKTYPMRHSYIMLASRSDSGRVPRGLAHRRVEMSCIDSRLRVIAEVRLAFASCFPQFGSMK
jgi:hypothetical protein